LIVENTEGKGKGRKRTDRPQRSSTAEILKRHPPFDLDAEMGVLGSVLILPEVLDDVATLLRSDDFYDDANRKLFTALREMYDEGEKIDITLLVSRLKKKEDFDAIGGAAYLGRLSQAVPNAAHAVYYGRIVAEKATYRKLIESSTEILGRCVRTDSRSPRLGGTGGAKDICHHGWSIVQFRFGVMRCTSFCNGPN
jgi:replicative DNA helicase